MAIESIKHGKDKRVLIPSSEEAGYETASPAVREGKDKAQFPKNPVVHRGQDPELFWMNKYGADDKDDLLNVDIRSLYRHEHIAPETLINRFYSVEQSHNRQLGLAGMFGNETEIDEIDKIEAYYHDNRRWTNRLIQGDSLLVMTSLLEREGLAGKVQCIYIDPPYGIKYGSNWQMRLNNRTVKDGSDDDLTGEPEQIKAYRDTWEFGIHSYLSYLRDRLVVAHDLLAESGSCFVQISDENIHLVRCLLDDVFGSDNFISMLTYTTSVALGASYVPGVCNYLLFYAKDKGSLKFRRLFQDKKPGEGAYTSLMLPDGRWRSYTKEERTGEKAIPPGARSFFNLNLLSAGRTESCVFPVTFDGRTFNPGAGRSWKTNASGMQTLISKGRVIATDNTLRYVLFHEDYPVKELTDVWADLGGASDKEYVVQTNVQAVQRCILMATDPGDLVLDPTCGSGTTAYVAEQWGRRWITIDTSRIALNIAKTRLMTATLPYYKLHDEQGRDIRQGFVYKKVPHITLKSIANNEPAEEETLYDQPQIDNKKLRVAGPFTVETLQSFEPVSPDSLESRKSEAGDLERFEECVFEHLKSAGVKTGMKEERAVFHRIQRLNSPYLHAEGFYQSAEGEKKAYLHIGPKFGTVSRLAVNQAVRDCRTKGDADWLIILGFTFESNISSDEITTSLGSFQVTKARMHDDLMQDGLLKRDKKAASFVTIGEPDIRLTSASPSSAESSEARIEGRKRAVMVEICGLDIYDPIKDEVKPRDVADISYWMVDDDYDGSNFIVRQVFFCGGDKDEFDKWRKGLQSQAAAKARKNVEQTLKIEIDDEAFARVYGHKSHPIEIKSPDQKIAVRVISQFGEECTKVLKVPKPD